jgi:diguanylate cyclase (GGDEF)-like protein
MFLEEGFQNTQQNGQLDFLTGTLNRRAIEEYLTVEIARSSRTHSPVSVMMVEIDHFSTLTAIHGPAKTDEILCTVVKTIGSILRFYDKCGRLSEDKLLVLLPENVAEHALIIASRFREALKSPNLPHDQPAITLSIGITQSAFKELTADVLARAELALVDARRKGRDCASLGYPAMPQLQSIQPDRLASGSRIAAKVSR